MFVRREDRPGSQPPPLTVADEANETPGQTPPPLLSASASKSSVTEEDAALVDVTSTIPPVSTGFGISTDADGDALTLTVNNTSTLVPEGSSSPVIVSSTEGSAKHSKNNGIIGAAVGCTVAICILVAVIIHTLRANRRRKSKRYTSAIVLHNIQRTENEGGESVLQLNRPISRSVLSGQQAALDKSAAQAEVRGRRDLEAEVREVTRRLADMEARMQLESPPEYSAS
ncbi:hypothetical protein MKEN_01310800 [Mycena kentingensis (nom. inval.)]|nr:hypothetical protein MKEN_01310800 [Mycena kentingensis (nom. inval.)]